MTTQTADEMFADADLDAETSVDAPSQAEQEQALIEASTPEDETPVVEAPEDKHTKVDGIRDKNVFEKGTWQAKIVESAILTDRSAAAKNKAGALLWAGATAAITEWEARSDVDVYAEHLAADLLDIMGTSRKGDVSKIKTVALAVKNAGLVLSAWPNLAKAYGEATRLTKTVKEERAEDDAAEVAVEAIAASAPASTTTPEGAALLLLSKGVDGAIVAILDALNGPSGENNEAAHRAFFRAVGVEIQSRVAASKPVKPAVEAGPKAGATVAKATPVKATPVKATPAKDKPATKTVGEKAAATRQPDATKKALPAKKAVPVKRS